MAGLDISLERVSYNVNSGVLKIIDFGFSDWMSDGAHTLPLPYVAPEQINVPFPSLELEVCDRHILLAKIINNAVGVCWTRPLTFGDAEFFFIACFLEHFLFVQLKIHP